jgi:hypothetical protein
MAILRRQGEPSSPATGRARPSHEHDADHDERARPGDDRARIEHAAFVVDQAFKPGKKSPMRRLRERAGRISDVTSVARNGFTFRTEVADVSLPNEERCLRVA